MKKADSLTCAYCMDICSRKSGRKYIFMGCEFGQVREWAHDTSLEWHVLQCPNHSGTAKLGGGVEPAFTAANPDCTCSTPTPRDSNGSIATTT